MEKDLSPLSPAEMTLLKDAYAYITVLIAGCDGKIDPKELAWAEKIAQIRTFAGDERLDALHEEVNVEIAAKIRQLIADLPADTDARCAAISDWLSALNPVLASLDPEIGAILYKGYKTFAERIAKSSGGILSFFTIGPEEKKWIGLPMLTEIVYADEEEEEKE